MNTSGFDSTERTLTETDRRVRERLRCHAELIVAWSHALDERIRLEVVDIGEDGLRVRCRLPILEGLTGLAITLLPENVPLNKAIRVQWVHADDGGWHQAGLMFVS